MTAFVASGVSFLVAIALIPLLIRAARSGRGVDVPDARRVHIRTMPRTGGVAIALGSFLSLGVLALWGWAFGPGVPSYASKVILGTCAALLFGFGLLDDLRGVSVKVKLGAQLLAAGGFAVWAGRVTVLDFGALGSIETGWFALALGVLWLVGVVNSLNLTDGLDGLAGGHAFIALSALALESWLHIGSSEGLLPALALLGALAGFLVFNRPPARIFMGDCGSQFLGFAIGAAALTLYGTTRTLEPFILVGSALTIPLIDTAMAIVRRLASRRSVFSADREHIHHLMLDNGWRHRTATLVLLAISAGLTMLVAVSLLAGVEWALLAWSIGAVSAAGLLRLMGVFSFRGALHGLIKARRVEQEIRRELRLYEAGRHTLRRANTTEDWWRAVTMIASELGFLELVVVGDGEASHHGHTWESGVSTGRHLLVEIPLGLRNGSRLRAVVDAETSIESAARRLTVLARLLDGYDLIDNLPVYIEKLSSELGVVRDKSVDDPVA